MCKNVPAIGKVSTHDEGDFLFPELFDGDLKRVGFAFQVDEDGGFHAIWWRY